MATGILIFLYTEHARTAPPCQYAANNSNEGSFICSTLQHKQVCHALETEKGLLLCI